MYVQSYLFFNGRCEEALKYYGEKLGAKVMFQMRYGEAPPDPEHPIRPGIEDKIMHVSFQIGTTMLMASDGDCNDDGPAISGFSMSLTADDAESAKRYFDALAADGHVVMEWQQTFWAKGFGMLVDRFGVSWMIGLPDENT